MKAYVIAMDNEAQCLIDNLENPVEETLFGRRVIKGSLHGEDVLLVVAGIGKTNAAAATQFAIQSGATEIINFGVAGGLLPTMNVCDVFEVESTVQYDFDLTQVNGTIIGTLNEYGTPYFYLEISGRFPPARVATGDRFNDSDIDHELITTTLSCTLRDMECAAIAHVCDRAGVPFRAFKCVSDVRGNGAAPGQYIDNLNRCLKKLTSVVGG